MSRTFLARGMAIATAMTLYAAVSAATAGTGAASTAPAPSPTTYEFVGTATAGMTSGADLNEAARSLDAQARSADAASYAGASVDSVSHAVHIYLTSPPSDALTSAARSSVYPVAITLVQHTMAELEAAQAKVTANIAALARQGVNIIEVGVDPTNNGVHVGLLKSSAPAQNTVQALTPIPVAVTFEQGSPSLIATRLVDVAPWKGGDLMVSLNQGNVVSGCTTGPPVVNPTNGHQYFLSVAHCFTATGQAVVNDDFEDSRGCSWVFCPQMGTSSHLDSTGGWDTALIAAQPSASNLDWQNSQPYNPPTTFNGFTNPQLTYSKSIQNELVCASGAKEGMVCNTTVLYADMDVVIKGVTYHHIDRAQNTSAVLAGPGDSGGPVFATPPGHLNMEGVMEAAGEVIPCVTYPARGTTCSHTLYYQDFGSMASHWGVVLKTS